MSHSHSLAPFAASTLWILISVEDLVDQAGLASHCFLGVLVVPLAQVDQRPQPEAWAWESVEAPSSTKVQESLLAPGSEELVLGVLVWQGLALGVLVWQGLALEALLWAKV